MADAAAADSVTSSAVDMDGGEGIINVTAAESSNWVSYVKKSVNNNHLPKQRFFKVPCSLLTEKNSKTYKPTLFQFGLWHGSPSTAVKDNSNKDSDRDSADRILLFKLQAAQVFCKLKQTSSSNRFEKLVKKLTESELQKKLKDCYGLRSDDQRKMSEEEAATSMALDIVTVYIAMIAEVEEFHPPCVRSIVRSDAILLDNQLPIFAFRCLLQTLYTTSDQPNHEEKVQVELHKLIKFYGCRDSPFVTEGGNGSQLWNSKSSGTNCDHADLKSLLGCIYDGWVRKEEVDQRQSQAQRPPDDRASAGFDKDLERGSGSAAGINHRRQSGGTAADVSPPPPVSHCSSLNVDMAAEEENGLLTESQNSNDSKSSKSICNHTSCCRSISSYRYHRSSATLLSAAHLYRRGIRFEAQQDPSRNWNLCSCITFDPTSATITLPKITVVHGTRRFLLNLLAYEHTSRFSNPCTLLSFVCFMDMLINSAEDVELLVDSGVVVNELGSHKHLATMWNGLTDGYPFRLSSVHQELVDRIRRESQRRWRRWTHTFRDSYYERRPWLFLSAVAALLLLLLTLLQTIYTIEGVRYHDPK